MMVCLYILLCLFHDEVHIRYIAQAPNAFSLIKNTLCAIIFCFVPQVIPKICVFSIYFYFYIVLPTSSCFCNKNKIHIKNRSVVSNSIHGIHIGNNVLVRLTSVFIDRIMAKTAMISHSTSLPFNLSFSNFDFFLLYVFIL